MTHHEDVVDVRVILSLFELLLQPVKRDVAGSDVIDEGVGVEADEHDVFVNHGKRKVPLVQHDRIRVGSRF